MLRVRIALTAAALSLPVALTGCIPSVPLPTDVFIRNSGTTIEVIYCGDWSIRSTTLRRGQISDFRNDVGGVTSEVPWEVGTGEPLLLTNIISQLGLDFETAPLRPGERFTISTFQTRVSSSGETIGVGSTSIFDVPSDWAQDQVDSAWFRSDRTLNQPSC